ncbi:MAG: C40 family peptidase, partial [Christensenellaceae bacterium]
YKKVKYYETVIETVEETIKKAEINVINKRYVQVLQQYPIDESQTEMVEMFLSQEGNELWEYMGIYFGVSGGGLAVGDINLIINDLPPGTAGSAIVAAALTRLGHPYSMDLRGQGNYVDCSYLSQWAYAQAGVSIAGTAASQAEQCVNGGKVIAESSLQAGDLVFWSYPNNPRVQDRFMAIGHVAIYVADGMMIEAAPSAGGVVYRAVSVQGTPAFYARPYV